MYDIPLKITILSITIPLFFNFQNSFTFHVHISPERHRMSAWHKDWQIGVLGLANPKRCATFSSVDGLMDRSLSGGKVFPQCRRFRTPPWRKDLKKKTAPSFYHDCQSCRKQDAFDVWMTAMYEISNYCCRVCECVSVISQYWSGKWFEVARQNSETTQKYLQ